MIIKDSKIEWNLFPVKEIFKRGWIDTHAAQSAADVQQVLHQYFEPLNLEQAILWRKTAHVRSARPADPYALAAWAARILHCALEGPPQGQYVPGSVTLAFMQEFVRLSRFEHGPQLAVEELSRHGIKLVIEPQLARTHLDGAALLSRVGHPVIGMTIRYDRVDNFWFTLMHELAHIARHLNENTDKFYDDLDLENPDDKIEREADELGAEALIPQAEWERSAVSRLGSPQAVQKFADQLQIHPAIVAGRFRHQYKAFRNLNKLVGHAEIRKEFPRVAWS
jgi:HTH-type transcriptional regulator/antitoxin HigA